MTEEGEDAHGNAAEEQKQILQLQSEQFRKTEQLQRLRERAKALEEELDSREAELAEVQRRCDAERHGAKRAPGEDRARAALAEDEYLRGQVRRILQDRVPAMASGQEEVEEEGDQLEKAAGPKQDDAGKTVHDTVLVSYVQSQDGRHEDYKVSYRIDSHTTVEQLHRDACAYWGCSRKDYSLWKIDSEDKPVALFKSPKPGVPVAPKLLQDAEVLNPAEAAHLHLCREMDDIRKAKQKERERERKEQHKATTPETQGQPAQAHHFLKTLKRGFGVATTDKQPEEFVNALRPWPGVYHLLNGRGRAPHHRQKWRPVAFSDILAVGFLILLSSLCLGYRDSVDQFLLRRGALETVVRGIPGETVEVRSTVWSSEATGLPPGAAPFEALTPGAAWASGGLAFNASAPGRQLARAARALAPSGKTLRLDGAWLPAADCAEVSVLVARGPEPPAADAPRISASWSCANASLTGPFGLRRVAPNCTRLGTAGGRFRLVVEASGTVSFEAGGDMNCELLVENGTLPEFADSAHLYVFVEAQGGGEARSVTLTFETPAPNVGFEDVKRMDAVGRWLNGPFAYQLLEPSSTLHRHYELASPLHVRQLLVKTKSCAREKLTLDLRRPCVYTLVDADTEETATLPPLNGNVPAIARRWRPAPVGASGSFGWIQRFYEASGYSFDVPVAGLTTESYGATSAVLQGALIGNWLSRRTRLLSLEFLLANKDLGGHVVVQLFLEFSASGALYPSFELLPVRLAPSYGTDVANGLDIARWVVVLVSLMAVRVYRETKREVLRGNSGLAYVFSAEGLLDAASAATFLAMQFMRLNGQPKLPAPRDGAFRSYSRAARDQRDLLRLEAIFLLLLIIRFVSFARMSSPVFRLFRAFGRTLRMFALYLAMFLPVFLSTTFLGTAIYGPYLQPFSTFLDSLVTMVFAMEESYEVEGLLLKSGWTIPFLTYFFLCTLAFFVHGFLAIAVHSYFEVQLVDGSEPGADEWSRDDWLQWMLWRPVYAWAVNGKGGARGRADESEAEVDEEESSSDEDEHEEKRR